MGKNIVICCDGTGNQFSQNNTNIVEIFSLVKNNSPEQVAYYDPGVGTWGTLKDKLKGYVFGWGLQINIEDAYRYLMNNCRPDDRIFLFGFSRGACTVRCLANMIHKCGLLFRGSNNLVRYASKIYNGQHNESLAAEFKNTFSQNIPVYFIGIFDSVSALGLIYGRNNSFDEKLSHEVCYGCHALAVDEKRRKFYSSLWDESGKQENQTIEQVWFPGVHSDVGGGYDEDELAQIPLKWMLTKATACGLLLKDPHAMEAIPQNAAAKIHNSLSWHWMFMGKKERKIPENALIHESVFARRNNPDCAYHPKNFPKNFQIVK